MKREKNMQVTNFCRASLSSGQPLDNGGRRETRLRDHFSWDSFRRKKEANGEETCEPGLGPYALIFGNYLKSKFLQLPSK
jgi:hypothetical protein